MALKKFAQAYIKGFFMKHLFTFVWVITVFIVGCTSSENINGRSVKAANRSVNMIKDRLSTEQRIEFEISYWTVRDAIKNNEEFLALVDGKSVAEMITLGKENFKKRKQSGFSGYAKYTNWQQMIAQFTQARINQDRRQGNPKKNRDNNVLYNL